MLMPTLRLTLSCSAALFLTFATAAMAESTGAAPQAVCEGSAQVASREGDTQESSFLCYEALCESDSDCQAACPTAQTATCVQSSCQYTYSGGGPGGGGGPFCSARFCSDDWDCECNGRYGYCGSDSTCHF